MFVGLMRGRGVRSIDAPWWPRAEMKTDGIDEQRSEIRRRVRVRVNCWGRVDNMFGGVGLWAGARSVWCGYVAAVC